MKNKIKGLSCGRFIIAAILLSIIILLFLSSKSFADDVDRTVNVGNISLVVTNYGTVGLAFATPGRLSCEYPIGSHIEHLYWGGLWVGGIQNNQTKVTTGAVDASLSNGGSGARGFEFTTGYCIPGQNNFSPEDSITERSLLPTSPYYDPNAVSHQDFICDYTDSNTCVPQNGQNGGEILDHDPLGIIVHQETYAWSQSFADAYAILRFTVKNASRDIIQEPYIGYWIDTMVGNTAVNPPSGWAPSYSWSYYDDGNNYIDSLQMGYEYDYDGDYGYAESYIGMRVLGTTPALIPDSGGVRYLDRVNFWEWLYRDTRDPVFFEPQQDAGPDGRYAHLSSGLNDQIGWRSATSAQGPLNRSMLISTGPFPDLQPDSSATFVFAIVCANKYGPDPESLDTELSKRNLYLNSRWAKISYDGEDKNGNGILDPGEDLPPYNGVLDRYRLPEASPPPNIKIVAGDHKVDVYWDNSPESFLDPVTGDVDFEGYKIYRATLTRENQNVGLKQLFQLIGQCDQIDSVGYNTGLDFVRLPQPETLDGREYQYRFTNDDLLNGWQYAFAVTAFDKGDPANNLPSLESSSLLSYGRAFPGSQPEARGKVTVFPNPYKISSLWDGLGEDGIQERSRILYFANLPEKCTIKIYTIAGDLVDVIDHDGATYNGSDINWFKQYAGGDNVFSGGIHGWDLVTKSDQAVATGLYLYTVEDKSTGDMSRGKFVVIK